MNRALQYLIDRGVPDGDHHKAYTIDQMVRILCECPTVTLINEHGANGAFEYQGLGENDAYREFLRQYADGEDGPHTYRWDFGCAP